MGHFTRHTFAFLNDLDANNNREWFKANQDRYEAEVREPALDFVTGFAPLLSQFAPRFRADARKVGGSLFRIQRDTRFSEDKTPYKTNTGVHFRYSSQTGAAGDGGAHSIGYYLHIEPRNCFMGLGLWRPATATAYDIRARIDAEPEAWTAAVAALPDGFALTGDSLKRPPKGYDPDHPLIDDLKRKDFIASTTLTQAEVVANDFLDRFADRCRAGTPFMAFLCEAIGADF